MKDRILKAILPLCLVVILLFFWQLMSDRGIINSALFSSPKDVFITYGKIDKLHQHILNSLYRLFISVFIGYVSGFVLGFLISIMKRLSFLEDIVSFFMSIPGISWAPLFIMTIGFGDKTIVLVGIITAFFPVIYNVTHGIKAIDKNLINLAKLLEYSGPKALLMVRIPAIMNYLLIALKLSFARTWRTIIAVEMIAATMFGLGYMIFDARELLNSKVMYAGILLSGLLYYCIEQLIIRYIEKATVIRWGMKEGHEE